MRSPKSWEKAEIDLYLETIGAFIVKPTTMGFGKSGVADRICCIDGCFVSIEVKREGKGPTPLQELRMKEVEKAGGFAVAGTAEVVIKYLKAAFA